MKPLSDGNNKDELPLMTQILAAHIGSYPRIGDQKDHQRHRRGLTHYINKDISAHAFRDVVQSVIQEAIAEQIEAGLDEVTDGLISWPDPISYFASKCSGFRIGGLDRYFDTSFHYRIPVITGKPKRKTPFVLDEIRYAKTLFNKTVRAVLTGPVTLASHTRSDIKTFDKLSSRISMFADLLELEISDLAKDGVPVIQIDEPSLFTHPQEAALTKKIFERFKNRAEKSILIVAASFLPPEAPLQNFFELPAGGYQIDIAAEPKTFFSRLDRFRPISNLGLGIVNAQTTKIDLPDPLLNALVPWLEKSAPETLYLTPSSGLEFLPRDAAQAKLKAVVRFKQDLTKRIYSPVVHG